MADTVLLVNAPDGSNAIIPIILEQCLTLLTVSIFISVQCMHMFCIVLAASLVLHCILYFYQSSLMATTYQ